MDGLKRKPPRERGLQEVWNTLIKAIIRQLLRDGGILGIGHQFRELNIKGKES